MGGHYMPPPPPDGVILRPPSSARVNPSYLATVSELKFFFQVIVFAFFGSVLVHAESHPI